MAQELFVFVSNVSVTLAGDQVSITTSFCSCDKFHFAQKSDQQIIGNLLNVTFAPSYK